MATAKVKFINTFDLRILWYKDLLSEIDSNFIPKTFLLEEKFLEDVCVIKIIILLNLQIFLRGKESLLVIVAIMINGNLPC